MLFHQCKVLVVSDTLLIFTLWHVTYIQRDIPWVTGGVLRSEPRNVRWSQGSMTACVCVCEQMYIRWRQNEVWRQGSTEAKNSRSPQDSFYCGLLFTFSQLLLRLPVYFISKKEEFVLYCLSKRQTTDKHSKDPVELPQLTVFVVVCLSWCTALLICKCSTNERAVRGLGAGWVAYYD